MNNHPMNSDKSSAKSDFDEEGLYGLLIVPIIGIAVSSLILIARRYQIHCILRCSKS